MAASRSALSLTPRPPARGKRRETSPRRLPWTAGCMKRTSAEPDGRGGGSCSPGSDQGGVARTGRRGEDALSRAAADVADTAKARPRPRVNRRSSLRADRFLRDGLLAFSIGCLLFPAGAPCCFCMFAYEYARTTGLSILCTRNSRFDPDIPDVLILHKRTKGATFDGADASRAALLGP